MSGIGELDLDVVGMLVGAVRDDESDGRIKVDKLPGILLFLCNCFGAFSMG